MARSTSSDSEDSAPELLTLSSTKKESRSQAKAADAFAAAQKAKRKSENRARDAALQERARETRARLETEGKSKKKRGKESKTDAVGTEVEERMKRAMQEAADEGSETDNEEQAEEWTGIEISESDMNTLGLSSANHLPEHLFAAAAVPPRASTSTATAAKSTDAIVKKKRKRSKTKERIVGSRTIRELSSAKADTFAASMTLPPTRINRFLKRTLRLKNGDTSSKKGTGAARTWERRPVNVGVLRTREGPALRFARGT